MIIIFLIIVVLTFYYNYRIFCLKRINKNYLNTIIKYEKIINEQGKKNHEYNNQLMIISGYINNPKKQKEYLKKIIGDYKTGQNYRIRQLYNLPNGGIKELLYYKISKIKEYNINYYLYISSDYKKLFENFDIKMYRDISRILGVLIDNAIEGSKDSMEKEIEFDFKTDDKYMIMVISNSYDKENIKIKNGKYKSTKGIGHGYGLMLVKEIVKKNKKIEVVNDLDKMFKQTILIEVK